MYIFKVTFIKGTNLPTFGISLWACVTSLPGSTPHCAKHLLHAKCLSFGNVLEAEVLIQDRFIRSFSRAFDSCNDCNYNPHVRYFNWNPSFLLMSRTLIWEISKFKYMYIDLYNSRMKNELSCCEARWKIVNNLFGSTNSLQTLKLGPHFRRKHKHKHRPHRHTTLILSAYAYAYANVNHVLTKNTSYISVSIRRKQRFDILKLTLMLVTAILARALAYAYACVAVRTGL